MTRRFEDDKTDTDLLAPEMEVLDDPSGRCRDAGMGPDALEPVRRRASSELRAAQGEAKSLPEGLEACIGEIGVGLIEADAEGRVIRLNEFAERITGWGTREASGQPLDAVFRLVPAVSPSDSFQGVDLASLSTAAALLRMRDMSVYAPDRTALLERRDGQIVPLRHAVGAAPGRTGQLIVFRDLSAAQLLSLQLARHARYDTLTGLLNRRAFEERIEKALAESRRGQARHGLCYFDLDRFRLVNLTCGHSAGDDLLQWVAMRIQELIGPRDAGARLGGDQFAMLLYDRAASEVERLVRDFQRRLLEFRFAWGAKSFSVGASFGLVYFGRECTGPTELLSAGDEACRQAKEHGRGRIQTVALDDEEVRQHRRSMDWVASLQRNLAEGRLRLYGQTVHPLRSPGSADELGAHFEILVRQLGEDGQLHSPVRIIQAAENIGLMDAIDRFVVRQALKTLGALPQRSLRRLKMCAINLSGISLAGQGLLEFIADELGRTNVPPGKICFEITETAALANLDEVLWLMQELKAMGCRFAIDDFGSGHASYRYVERLPVDHVKIDGSFVRDMLDNSLHRAIVESVYLIGRTLNIETVAEAVESKEVADLLAAIGIDYAQGWHFGKPRPLPEVCAELGR